MHGVGTSNFMDTNNMVVYFTPSFILHGICALIVALIKLNMASPVNSISAAANVDNVPFSGTCLVFTICVVDPLKVEGVKDRFFAFANKEGDTIMQECGSVSVAWGEQDHNPYATISENRSIILKQREMIKIILRELNEVYLHPSTIPPTSNYLMDILLVDEIDDYIDDDDDDIAHLGRLHSVAMSAQFDDDVVEDENDNDKEHLRRR